MVNQGFLEVVLLALVLRLHLSNGFRLYKPRQELLNLLSPSGESTEEKLFMDECSQSNDAGNRCEVAIDGEVIHDWTQCSAPTANSDPKPWWSANLETPSYVTRIIIHTVEIPSVDMVNALESFIIRVSGTECATHKSKVPFLSRTFSCDTFGESISIITLVNGTLALCEVEAYGLPVSFEGLDSGSVTELDLKHCEMSSTATTKLSHDCTYAIDRHFGQTEAAGNQCARTEADELAWFTGYFTLPGLVTHVKLFNLLDACCTNDLAEFQIKINDVLCAADLKAPIPKGGSVYKCDGFGTRVQLTSKKKHAKLSLCQVQVFGNKMVLLEDKTYTYKGCYMDNAAVNKTEWDMIVSTTFMSPKKCNKMCKRENRAYFALQNGQVCLCGNAYGKYSNGTTDDSEDQCRTPCAGDRKLKCGGLGYASVYEIVN